MEPSDKSEKTPKAAKTELGQDVEDDVEGEEVLGEEDMMTARQSRATTVSDVEHAAADSTGHQSLLTAVRPRFPDC